MRPIGFKFSAFNESTHGLSMTIVYFSQISNINAFSQKRSYIPFLRSSYIYSIIKVWDKIIINMS